MTEPSNLDELTKAVELIMGWLFKIGRGLTRQSPGPTVTEIGNAHGLSVAARAAVNVAVNITPVIGPKSYQRFIQATAVGVPKALKSVAKPIVTRATGVASESRAPTVAFSAPASTAVGYGRFATGGRSGQIIHVTNLNDSGAGSLRTACATAGARNIVFDVAGTINLSSSIQITGLPNFSIWGESAPGPIQIRGNSIVVRSNNFIIRHLVIRPEAGPDSLDCVRMVRFAGDTVNNGIVAYCTLQWAGDENISIFPSIGSPITDVTIQNCLICESMEDGVLIANDVDRISLIQNVMAKNHARHPRVHTFANLEIINNISYNCGNDDIDVGGNSATGSATPCNLSVINNRFIDGPSSGASNGCIHWGSVSSGQPNWDDGTSKLYYTGNVYVDTRSLHRTFLLQSNAFDPTVGTPPLSSGFTPQTADAAFETWLLARVGARPQSRDTEEAEVISELVNRTGTLAPSDTLTGYGTGVSFATINTPYSPPANPNAVNADGYTNLELDMFARSAALVPA